MTDDGLAGVEGVKEAIRQCLERLREFQPKESWCLYMNRALFDSLSQGVERERGYLAIRGESVPVVISPIADVVEGEPGAEVHSSNLWIYPLPALEWEPE